MNIGVDKQNLDGNAESKKVSNNWKLQYLDSNQVDLSGVLKLKKEDFKLGHIEFKHCTDSFKRIIFLIFD